MATTNAISLQSNIVSSKAQHRETKQSIDSRIHNAHKKQLEVHH